MQQPGEFANLCKAVRLIALDIDGTTLCRDGTMSQVTKEWLLRARDYGIEFTFATGRHRLSLVDSLAEELGICVPIVTANGSEVWAPDGQLLHRSAFTNDDIQVLYELKDRFRTSYWASTIDGPIREGQLPNLARIGDYTFIKFGFLSKDASVLAQMWEVLDRLECFELSNSDASNIEVNPRGVNKASGLQIVCNTVGILPYQVLAFGDSLNDISMFEFAGFSVAMGNAQPKVKQAARYVTHDCDEDGVADFLRRLLSTTPLP